MTIERTEDSLKISLSLLIWEETLRSLLKKEQNHQFIKAESGEILGKNEETMRRS